MFSFKIFVLCCSVLGVLGTNSTLEEAQYAVWGSSPYTNDTSIRDFEMNWTQEEIDHLIQRLNSTRSAAPSITKTFEYGFNSEVVKVWTDYWANEYNFTARMEFLNQFPQYMTTIQGLDIHFIRVKPNVTDGCKVVPLLILHGYPTSVAEYFELIPRLTKECVNGIAIEVVAVSMPGHYYSSAPDRAGCGAPEIATIMKILMNRLGFYKFYIHSNDCVHVDSMIATIYPESVEGLHLTNPINFHPLSWASWIGGAVSTAIKQLVVAPEYETAMYPIWEKFTHLMNLFGAIHFLATRPDTYGVALADSPSGVLALQLSFASWLNRRDNYLSYDGGLSEQFDSDVILDHVTVYWFTNCIGPAARIFSESFNWRVFQTGLYSKTTPVPTWAVNSKYNWFYQSPSLLQMKFPNLLGTEDCDAGLYPAYEQPDEMKTSIFNFIALATEWYANNNTLCQMQNV